MSSLGEYPLVCSKIECDETATLVISIGMIGKAQLIAYTCNEHTEDAVLDLIEETMMAQKWGLEYLERKAISETD